MWTAFGSLFLRQHIITQRERYSLKCTLGGLVSNLFFYKTPNLCILSNNAVPLSFRKLREELLLITSACQWVLSCIVFWLAQNVPVRTFENIGFISLLISQLLDWKVAKIIFRRNLSHLNKHFSFFKVPCHPPPPWMRNFLMRCCCMAPPPFQKAIYPLRETV